MEIKVTIITSDEKNIILNTLIFSTFKYVCQILKDNGYLKQNVQYYPIYNGVKLNQNLTFYDLQMTSMLDSYRLILTDDPQATLKSLIRYEDSWSNLSLSQIKKSRYSQRQSKTQKMVQELPSPKKLISKVQVRQNTDRPKPKVLKINTPKFDVIIYVGDKYSQPITISSENVKDIKKQKLQDLIRYNTSLSIYEYNVQITGQIITDYNLTIQKILDLYGKDEHKLEIILLFQ